MTANFEKTQVEQCDQLKTAFGALTKSPIDNGLKNEVSLLFHTIKGGSGSYGYQLATAIATEADDLLAAKDTLDDADIHNLANHVDALSLVVSKKITGHGGKAGRVLLQGLKDFS